MTYFRLVQRIAGVVLLALFTCPVILPLASLGAQRVASEADAEPDAGEGLMSRSVTLRLKQVSLRRAIVAVAEAASVQVMYQTQLLTESAELVTIDAHGMPLGEVLRQALAGTHLQAVPVGKNIVSIGPVGDAKRQLDGVITGVVIDATTRKPIAGATVTENGVNVARTNDDGTFRLSGIATGVRHLVVRRLGYQMAKLSVTVAAGETAAVTAELTPSTTRLNEVVTTAIGTQRRVEVGHVITHLNVDSIARTAPVKSLTDILTARAPGVQIIETDGLVGSGPAIRIRGQSSMALQTDPIVIVDGIRQDNTAGGRGTFFSNIATPSPSRLNDIDFNQIESIDILKGPAASTEYGSDAANGVIVITTKRGKVGKPRWHAGAERGWNEVPFGFPEIYYGWGHLTDSAHTYSACTLTTPYNGFPAPSVIDGTCVIDSVTHYNPLNHRATSVYGRGLRERYDVDVSGGANAIRYYVGAGAAKDVGTLRLPSVFHSQARNLGFPSSVLEPNVQEQRSARTTLSTQLGSATELVVQGAYLTTDFRSPLTYGFLDRLMGELQGGVYPLKNDSAGNYGYSTSTASTPLATLGRLEHEKTTRTTAGASIDWRPALWFTGHATAGIDHGSQQYDEIYLPQAYRLILSSPDRGQLGVANTTTDFYSSDVRASAIAPLGRHMHSTTSVGVQLAKTISTGVSATVEGLSESNTTLNGVPNPTVRQTSNGSATAGTYVEEQLNVAERLFVTAAVRADAGSGFGRDYNASVYPKLSASWLAINSGPTVVRARAAFGAAGVQPSNGAALHLYNANTVVLENGSVGALTSVSPGNPDLRPERSQEFEGGVDVGLWENRANLELTYYRKRTRDALVNRQLGWDAGFQSIQQNLGEVHNRGTELTLQAALLDAKSLGWDLTLNASTNHNRLIRLAPGVIVDPYYFAQRSIPGYPLFGYWGRKATFADANGDGIIAPEEVTIADSATYLGSSSPTRQVSLSNRVRLFRGALSIGTLFDYKGGYLLGNGTVSYLRAVWGTLREQVDPNAPLWEQARIVGTVKTMSANSLYYEDASSVRFRELSMTYNVPMTWTRKLRFQNVAVTAAVRNLALWTNYTGGGGDPEVGDTRVVTDQASSGGSYVDNNQRGNGGSSSVPLTRTWMLRISAGL